MYNPEELKELIETTQSSILSVKEIIEIHKNRDNLPEADVFSRILAKEEEQLKVLEGLLSSNH